MIKQQLLLMEHHRRPCSSDLDMPKWATLCSTSFINLLCKILGSTESHFQSDDLLWLHYHCCEFCVAVRVIVDNNLMFKSAGCRPAITHTHSPLSFTKKHKQKKQVCADTLRVRSSHADATLDMLKKQWLEGVRGQGGTRGKSGTQRSFASAPFVRCQPSICLDNFVKILRVALSQHNKRGISEGRGQAARTLFLRVRHRNN